MGKQRPILAAAMAAGGIVGVYRWLVRPRLYTWGATADEATAELPGDDLVEVGAPRTTRAVGIAMLSRSRRDRGSVRRRSATRSAALLRMRIRGGGRF